MLIIEQDHVINNLLTRLDDLEEEVRELQKYAHTKYLIVWDDQQVNLGTVAKGASAPTDTPWKGSQVLAFDKAQDNLIYFEAQLTHRYELESELEFHVHVAVPDNTAGDVVWQLTYSWADVNDAFPTETTVTATQTIVANSLDVHLYFDIKDDISGSGSDVSSILLCSLARLGTNGADDYNNDVYLVALDFHIQMDDRGSHQELVK